MGAYLMELPHQDGRGGGVASILVHSGLIAGAVLATMQTAMRPTDPHPIVEILYHPPEPAAPPPAVREPMPFGVPSVPLALPGISSVVPRVIPPPSTAAFDPAGFAGLVPAVVAAAPDTLRRGGGSVYTASGVDEPPELLSHPAMAFPEILRQAGIGGRVVIQAVIDTGGRAERGSLRVLSASHALFEQPALDLVAGSVYRAGRLDGRAVRVLVVVPVVFQVSARGGTMFGSP